MAGIATALLHLGDGLVVRKQAPSLHVRLLHVREDGPAGA